MTILSSKTFNELIDEINEHLTNDRDRGTAFEKMVVAYLKNEPIYKKKYSDVWMLSDVPTNLGISRIDTGVDIVAKDFNGQLTAVQAKFYKGKVGKDAINSFVAETGKDCYSAGIIVSTTDECNKMIYQLKSQKSLEDIKKKQSKMLLNILRAMKITMTVEN